MPFLPTPQFVTVAGDGNEHLMEAFISTRSTILSGAIVNCSFAIEFKCHFNDNATQNSYNYTVHLYCILHGH